MTSLIFNFLAIIVLGITQLSFLVTWPWPVNTFNLILISTVLLTATGRFSRGLWWAFGGGLFLDLFNVEIFGLHCLSLLLTVIIINFLFTNFFTNYSFYSLIILGAAGTLSYNLLLVVCRFLSELLGANGISIDFNLSLFFYFFWQTILNLLILSVIFFVFNFLENRFKIDISSHTQVARE